MKTEIKAMMEEKIKGFRLPRYEEIPDVGFYLEQTTKYINGYLEPIGWMEVTSAMISNYVKKGIIPKPIKKQYFAEHIAYLFFVVIAKNLLSMENIKLLIQMQKKSYSNPVAYNYLCRELENMLFYIFGLKESPDIVGKSETEERELLYSLVSSAAHVVYMHSAFGIIREQHEQNTKEEK